ncbi:hypothetical protein BDV96DRAFT_655344 [Lophiotrema nucula]|uniref:Uncharacterized protein n=1 Tax=Lophiotrema nucula TaxID=690887 RepID=A0A6A5YHT7_9PLEO|nr:hypothetical protein BDV96DRAFT_655344 [Lophiotrema nucula]
MEATPHVSSSLSEFDHHLQHCYKLASQRNGLVPHLRRLNITQNVIEYSKHNRVSYCHGYDIRNMWNDPQPYMLRNNTVAFAREAAFLQSEITKSLEVCAKIECRALCDKIMDRLPREVRDMIYRYFLRRRLYCEHYMQRNWKDCEKFYGTKKPVAHFTRHFTRQRYAWMEQLLDHPVWAELAEAWYRLATFKLDYNWGAAEVNHLLYGVKWGLGRDPKQFIKRLRVILGKSHVFNDDRHQLKTEYGIQCKALQQLERLLLIESGRVCFNIELFIGLPHDEGPGKDLAMIRQQLTFLFPLLLRIKERKWDFRVLCWVESEEYRFTPDVAEFCVEGWMGYLLEQHSIWEKTRKRVMPRII